MMELSVPVSPTHRHRYPSGKKRPTFAPRRAGSATIKARFRSHRFDQMARFGADPVWASEVGMMHLDGILSDAEADAAALFAETAGRYDRYHPAKLNLAMTPRSPAFTWGNHASDTEIERHNQCGTIRQYERRAKQIRKRWHDMQLFLANEHERTLVTGLCLLETRPPEAFFPQLKLIMAGIAKKFGLTGRAEAEHKKPVDRLKRNAVLKARVAAVIAKVVDWFAMARAAPVTFQLCATGREIGVKVYGRDRSVTTCVMLSLRRDDLAEHVAHMLLKQCEVQGWTDHPKQS